MPDKEGDDEKKSTKSVVNKKQKQMMGEEGYDIARDMGKVSPSKDKKDATTMPVSDEVKKTQKKSKGKSAVELVKSKYGKSVMNVGKKKANEELDLSKVAEAFGGYIVNEKLKSLTGDPEEITSKIKKEYSKTRKTRQDTKAADQAAEMSKKRGEFAKSFGGDSDVETTEKPERVKTKMAKNIAKQDIEKETGEKFVGGSKSGPRKKTGVKYGESPGAGPVKIIQPAKTKSQKEAELEGKRKDYLDPKTNKASPEGIKKYITKARQMRSGSNVPVDQETTDNIAKIAGPEYEKKINQKYGGRRAGRRQSTATEKPFATRTGESGGPLPVSMRNKRVPKTSSLSAPVTTTPTFKGFQDKVKTVSLGKGMEVVNEPEYTQQTIPGMGPNIEKGSETVKTRTRGFKPDKNYIKPQKGYNPDQTELPFGKDQRQVSKPPSDMLDRILNRNRRRSKGENEVKDYMDKFRTPPEKEIKGLIPPSKTKGLIGTGRAKPVDVTDLRTQTDGGGGNGGKNNIVGTGAGDGGKKKPSPFSTIKQFARKNPAAALAGYDLGKGILGKIMKARVPNVPTPRAIRVSAKS